MSNSKIKFKMNNKKIIICFFILAVVIYSLYITYKLVKEPTDTFMVDNGKLYLEESTVGYVIREETVIKGENYKNGIVQIKAEGQRVSKDEAIFRYYSNSEEKLIKKIQDLDLKIQEAMPNENSLFTSDMKILENHIGEQLNDLYKINDLQKIIEYKNQINSEVTKKSKIIGDLSPSGSYIKQLIEERSSYEAQLNSGSERVNAPVSGIVSYRVDGLEDVLTPNNFASLNEKFLNDLKLKTGQVIASSTESGKIINNFNSYIAVCVKSEEGKKVKVEDKNIKIRLSSSQEIPTEVVYVANQGDNKTLIVFKIDNCIEELINYRKISLDIIWWSDEGLKIPNSAIIDEDGLSYVIRNRAGYLDKILVNILRQNENYSIVTDYKSSELEQLGFTPDQIKTKKNISLYDEILIKPKSFTR